MGERLFNQMVALLCTIALLIAFFVFFTGTPVHSRAAAGKGSSSAARTETPNAPPLSIAHRPH
jgi:hypothetical protein